MFRIYCNQGIGWQAVLVQTYIDRRTIDTLGRVVPLTPNGSHGAKELETQFKLIHVHTRIIYVE